MDSLKSATATSAGDGKSQGGNGRRPSRRARVFADVSGLFRDDAGRVAPIAEVSSGEDVDCGVVVRYHYPVSATRAGRQFFTTVNRSKRFYDEAEGIWAKEKQRILKLPLRCPAIAEPLSPEGLRSLGDSFFEHITLKNKASEMKRFTLGTISAGAAWFLTTFFVLWGDQLPNVLPIFVFAVPCYAAYHKEPHGFWRFFTVLSIVGTACITFFLAHAFSREIDGTLVFGFPIPYVTGEFVIHPDYRVIANHILISGVCLMPLAAFSTFDTVRTAWKTEK
jgi:hypothetical protein